MTDLMAQLQGYLDMANAYFRQLDDEEKYLWLGEGFGFILVVVGVVLFFV